MTDPHMAGQRRENNQCEDCGDDIGLLDVQGHYSGKCAKCARSQAGEEEDKQELDLYFQDKGEEKDG